MNEMVWIWGSINLVLCACIFFICFERLRITTHQTFWLVRWSFAALGVGAMAWAIAPLFWPIFAPPLRVVFSFGVAIHLLSHAPLWKGTPPRDLHYGSERRTGHDRRN